jgi:glycosyltransferase 2 family protein
MHAEQGGATSFAVSAADGEPPEPRRIRRQPDLMRLLFELLMIAVVVVLGKIGVQTTSGLESDIHSGAQVAPAFLLSGITALANIVTAVIPVGLAVELLVRRDGRRVADAVLAAALAFCLSSVLNIWIRSSYVPKWLLAELTRHIGSGTTMPLHVYITTLIALLAVLGFNDRQALRVFTGMCIGIYAVATLISGDSALVGLVVTFLLGRAVAFGWRCLAGVVNKRPTGQRVLSALSETGLVPVSCVWEGDHDSTRRYEVGCADGLVLDAIVLERDRQAVGGLIYWFYRWIRLRGPVQQRGLFSLRRAINQEALISYALRDAGISTPRLVTVRVLSADAALLAYERSNAVALEQLAEQEVTDALLIRVWQTIADLGRRQLAHRRLAPDSILVDEQGEIWLGELRNGEIGATDLQQLLDIAETLIALALKTDPERAVRTGAQVLGPDRLALALPMLQPVVLPRTTRAAVRKSKHLLQQLRREIQEIRPHSPTAETVRLERLSPKTLLTIAAGCFAVYALLFEFSTASQQSGKGIVQLLAESSPGWLAVAVCASALTYLSAAMVLIGYVPEKLSWLQSVLVQVAASFVGLVAPAAVGGVALNARYLQKRGVPTGAAVGAVGASQAVNFVIHIALIATFSFVAGQRLGKSDSSQLIIAILLLIAILSMITMAVAPLRRLAQRTLGPSFKVALPRLLDVAQNPMKLATAIGGTVSLSLFYTLCLWASLHAVTPAGGHQLSYPTTAVVFLTAQAAGSFIPVPGGVGSVELAVVAALKLVGVSPVTAVVATLIYRLLCTYLPVIPGYVAFHYLQRKELV